MAKIFISVSLQDRKIAFPIIKQLKEIGHIVLNDDMGVSQRANYDAWVRQNMQEADVYLFIITPNGLDSKLVIEEFSRAEALAESSPKLLIPLTQDGHQFSRIDQFQTVSLDDSDLISKIQRIIENHFNQLSELRITRNKASEAEFAISGASTNSNSGDKSNCQYWFIKLNPKTWNLYDFEKYYNNGDEALFGTHNLENERRIDYDMFFNIKTSDKVIGYAFEDRRAVECIFEVIQEVNVRREVGEVIALKIQKVITPPIPLEYFSDLVNFKDKLDADDPERLFPIDDAVFHAILNSDSMGYTTQARSIQNYTTEGDHRSTEDQLSFTADIASFGTVICLKKVKPPLAIGLFGRWGSGKSFFMDKLSDYVDKVALTDDERYVQSVVQVKFNSWHYSDANLWASLITEIFDSLNTYAGKQGKISEIEKLSATLQLTNLHRDQAELRKKELFDKVSDLRKKQQNSRERLDDLSGFKFLKLLISDPNIKKDLESLNNAGIDSIKENQEKIESYIKELSSSSGKLKAFLFQFTRLKGVRWWWLIIIALVVFTFAYAVESDFTLQWSRLTMWISVKVGLATAVLGKLVEAIRSFMQNFESINHRWSSLKKTFNERLQQDDPELKTYEQDLNAVVTELKVIDQKISQTKREIDDISSGKKLMNFIGLKSRDEAYAKQLGLIASIRKDFKTLDNLLREQYVKTDEMVDNPENVQLKIDRIILYIDDLDRCNEDLVVRVLEAIHLLLAFPLFVVIVGVDPRWLNNALNKKYTDLFHAAGQQQNITSFDYLEKIFQIPFALKEADKDDRNRLLKYLMRNEIEKNPIDRSSTENKIFITPSSTTQATKENAQNEAKTKPAENLGGVLLNEVDFQEKEISFMDSISGMFGETPRMINRYVNIYRIIKSHKNYHVGIVPSARDYKSTMFVLAVIVGCPQHAREFIELLNKTKIKGMLEFVEALPDSDLRNFIHSCSVKDAVEDLSTTMVKRNLELISRFSFRTYDIKKAEPAMKKTPQATA